MTRQQQLLREGLIKSTALHPEKTALVVEGKQYTYGRLLDTAYRIAGALSERGLQRGDRVAVYMDNTWPCIVSIYGTLLAGGVFLMINPQTKAEKLHYVLQDSEAKFLMTDSHLSGQCVRAVHDLPVLQAVIASGTVPFARQPPVEVESFDSVVQESTPLTEPGFVIPNDLAALIYTSGSTGNPKGVMQTHQAMVFAAWSLIEYLRLAEHDRILLVLPLAFDYGLYQLLMAMKLGATLIVERSFTFPGHIYKKIREEEVTVFPGVPTIFATMISGNQKKKLVFPGITRITNTAAALPADFISQLHEIFPNALIYKMYGLTECKRVSYLEPELVDEKPASVGKAIPGTEVFLRSPDGDEVPAGEPGILHVRGPHIMVGYWKRPDLSAEMLKPGFLPGERILCTGDWFIQDEEGFLFFSGRSDDIIKTRGEKVSPLEVEQTLHGIAGIKEAVVVGIDDLQLGQAVQAFVVLQDGSDLTDRKIKKICLAGLENFMVPQSVVILDKLPKTANGKVDKKLLLGQYCARTS
jgi:acyl-CoA synthetase (AMP-forming)/AMP-acid ligase II